MGEENLKLPKGYRTYLIVLLVVAVLLIIPASREKIFDTLNLFGGKEKELKLVNDFNVDREILKIHIADEKIIEWEGSELSFLDFNGFEVLKKEFASKDVDVMFKDDIYVMDKASGKIELLDSDGNTIKNIDLKSSFRRLSEEEDKLYIYRKDEDYESVDIIDKEGELLKTHEEFMPILTLNLTEKNDKYLVSNLHVEEELKSVVTIYSLDGEEISKFEFKDEIVVYSSFIKDDAVVATESNIYFLDGDKIKWQKEIKDLKDIRVEDKNIYLLHANKYQVLNQRGKLKEDIDLEKSFDNIRFIEGETLLFNKKDAIIPHKKGNLLEFNSEKDIMDVKYNDENLLIHKDGELEIYNIIEKGEN